jgi:hypothetical protein
MPEDAHAPLNAAQSCCGFAREHVREITLLYNSAKVDLNNDRGLEIQQLAQMFEPGGSLEKHPELLQKLCQLAQTNSLFGKTRAELGDDAFYKMRREFLVDVIRGTINSDNIIQGREPMCTAASALKLLEPAEYARVATDLALSENGEAITESGAVLKVYPGFFQRAQTSSARLNGDIFCAQPSAGSLMLLYSVIQLGDSQVNATVPLLERQDGAYWYEYTMAVQKLTGKRFGCAGINATDIGYDNVGGRAVRGPASSAPQSIATFDYVKSELTRDRPVFIHTFFNAGSTQGAVGRAHSEHAMVAEAIVASGTNGLPNDGHKWVRVSNPIGDFFKIGRDAAGRPVEFGPGDILGDRNSFWFVAGDKGDIYVREDVLKSNLYSALVRYDERYTFQPGDTPQGYGTLDTGGDPHRFMWVDGPAELADTSEDQAAAPVQRGAYSVASFDASATPQEPRGDRDDDSHRATTGSVRRRSREEEEMLSSQMMAAKSNATEEQSSASGRSVASFATLGEGVRNRAFGYGVDGGREAVVARNSFDSMVARAISQPPARDTTLAPAQERPTLASTTTPQTTVRETTAQQPTVSPRLNAIFGNSA